METLIGRPFNQILLNIRKRLRNYYLTIETYCETNDDNVQDEWAANLYKNKIKAGLSSWKIGFDKFDFCDVTTHVCTLKKRI